MQGFRTLCFGRNERLSPGLRGSQTLIVESKMDNIRSLLASTLVAAAFVALPAQTALAQQAPPATIVRTVMAVISLPSVTDTAVFFKLSKIVLAPGQTTKYPGPVGFLYVLSGALVVQTGV